VGSCQGAGAGREAESICGGAFGVFVVMVGVAEPFVDHIEALV
jgi:hypothetical protein